MNTTSMHQHTSYLSILPILRCVSCGGGALQEEGESLFCPSCRAQYPLKDGIPRFAPVRAEPQGVRDSAIPSQKEFAGVGGCDYHTARKSSPTLRYSLQRRTNSITDVLRSRFGDQPFSILEAGCADGLMAQGISQSLSTVGIVGMDIQTDHFFANPYPVVQGTCESMPLKDDNFDAVIAAALIEHIPDPCSFLREAYRVLRPGGVLVLTCPDPVYDWICTITGYFRHAGHLHRFSLRRLKAMLGAAAFSGVDGKKFMLSPVPCRALERLERGIFRCLFSPIMMNQVAWGVKLAPSLSNAPTPRQGE